MTKLALVDVDDLWCKEQITSYLLPLRCREELRITCYGIPNKLGPVDELKKKFPWLTFAIHGWEHTHFECRAWTEDNALYYMSKALDMGYDKIFKPPNWIFDAETAKACNALGIVLHHHEKIDPPKILGLRAYPGPKIARGFTPEHEYIHTHLQRNPSTDWVGNHPGFRTETLVQFSEFATPDELAITLGDGK